MACLWAPRPRGALTASVSGVGLGEAEPCSGAPTATFWVDEHMKHECSLARPFLCSTLEYQRTRPLRQGGSETPQGYLQAPEVSGGEQAEKTAVGLGSISGGA